MCIRDSDEIDANVAVGIDVGPTRIWITVSRIWPFDVYTRCALVEDFSIRASGFTGMPTIVVFFTDIPIIVVDTVFVAEAELFSVPDRYGILGGCDINIVGIP